MLCEIPGCNEYATETHHIFSIGAKRAAALTVQNEIMLCADHHRLSGDAVHNLGRDTWAEKFGFKRRVQTAFKAVTRERERLNAL